MIYYYTILWYRDFNIIIYFYCDARYKIESDYFDLFNDTFYRRLLMI